MCNHVICYVSFAIFYIALLKAMIPMESYPKKMGRMVVAIPLWADAPRDLGMPGDGGPAPFRPSELAQK